MKALAVTVKSQHWPISDMVKSALEAGADALERNMELQKLAAVWYLSANPSDWERADELREIVGNKKEKKPQECKHDYNADRVCNHCGQVDIGNMEKKKHEQRTGDQVI